MSDDEKNTSNVESSAWIRAELDAAIAEISAVDGKDENLVEARPIWSVPHKVMLGQVRGITEQGSFTWVISGAGPTDRLDSSAAATPREAIRHFSLKWQLDAARQSDPVAADALATQAEALYELYEEDSLWKDA